MAVMISGSGAIENTAKTIPMIRGTVLFIPANTTFDLKCNGRDTEIYRAYCVL